MPTNIAQEIGKSFISGGWSNILSFGLIIGATIAFGTITYAGFIYLTGADNAAKQKDALDMIKAAATGLAILTFGYIILRTINPNVLNTTVEIQNKQDKEINQTKPESIEFPSETNQSASGSSKRSGEATQ